ncbi:MAG TPA: hypothetical protein VGP06_13140 [Janthinobacterium sp.]|nr:hypothetical protein [Janthinobacterium sp.]
MKTMQWLIRREMWEHKGMLLRAPLVLAAVMLVLGVISMLKLLAVGTLHLNINGHHSHVNGASFAAIVVDRNPDMLDQAVANYMASAMPLLLMLAVVVFFYCLGALYDERRDRSLLFWKSLPVSDAATVLSKAALALLVAPLVAIVVGSLLSMLLLLLLCGVMAVHGLNLFGAVLANPAFYLGPLRMLGLLPVYALWALPTVGWLLMVSAWARSKVFLWAVGVPLLAALLAVWAGRALALDLNGPWFFEHIVGHILLGVVPGCWLLFERAGLSADFIDGSRHIDMGDIFTQSWATLASPGAWTGVAAGAAMLYAAVWLRRRRDEG